MQWLSLFRVSFFLLSNSLIIAAEEILPGLLFYGDIIQSDDTNLTNSKPNSGNNPYNVIVPSTPVSSKLYSLQVKARIIDGIAEVTMTQQFQTPTFFPPHFLPREAAYQIPLDELAAVTEFRANIDDRVIEAIVKERSEAIKDFEEALSSGQNAYLAQQIRADIFRISVGNLPMDKLVTVTLVYVTSLDTLDNDTVRFVFPTDLTPRYTPIKNSEEPIPDGLDMMDNGIDIQLDVSMGANIISITSNTHEIQSNLNSTNTTITNQSQQNAVVHVTDENPQERDLAILITTETNDEPVVYFESSMKFNTTAMMLSIVPNISTELMMNTFASNLEFIFIVDRSGSMSGNIMNQTRVAMSRILEQVPTGSLFNIIGFGSSFEVFFEESQSIQNIEAFNKALEHIQEMNADLGGTEILQPLTHVLEGKEMPLLVNFNRIIFVLTDGEVSNTQDVIEFVRKHNSNGRIFALGIGEHVSALLVRGIARAGNGSAEFVDGDSVDAIEDAVTRQMSVASLPALTDVSIDWDKGFGTQAPFETPNLLTGKRFLVFYMFDHITNNILPQTIKVTSNVMNTANIVDYEIDSKSFLELSKQSDGLDSNLIHKMACRSMIRDLEEGSSKLHSREASPDDITKEIVRLGLLYQIASSQTSFIAVDDEKWIDDEKRVYDSTKRGGILYRSMSPACQRSLNILVLIFSGICIPFLF